MVIELDFVKKGENLNKLRPNKYVLDQGCPLRGPRAAGGPRDFFYFYLRVN